MSDTIIRVENLGKKYILGHQKQERYTALRDVMANGAKSFGRKVLKPFGKKIADPGVNEFWALKDVSFEIKQGDRIGIIGRNGAGKSTLLKILSRITEPTCGRISIKGRIASLLEVGTGFHPELTGRENIFLNGAILGMSKAEITRKFDEIVAFAEVEKFLDTPVKRYSSGMYVRLAFSVAAHLEPEILIVDEVLAVGDSAFQKKCLGKMEDVGKEGRTVLFVSHTMSTITTLCQKAIWLSHGHVEMQGDAEQITSKYLMQGAEHSGEVILKNNDSSQRFEFKRVSLLNHTGNITSAFDIRDPIKIQLEYYATKLLKNLEISLRVYNSSGIPIFTTNRSSYLSSDVTAGDHISEIEIPSLFLAPGFYTIDIGAHIPKIEIVSEYKSLLTFEVDETGSGMSVYHGAAYGVIMVNLPWKALTNSSSMDKSTNL
jgi:lipopolysaccharide transport system ATP-binding protein